MKDNDNSNKRQELRILKVSNGYIVDSANWGDGYRTSSTSPKVAESFYVLVEILKQEFDIP